MTTALAPIPEDPELAHGFWVAPTLFTDVTHKMRIAAEEIFGPVVAVMRFGDEDETVAIVNESEYGLTSAIYTADSARGFRMARRIEAGMVFLNNYFRSTGARRSAAPSTPATAASTRSRRCASTATPRSSASHPVSERSRPGARSMTSSKSRATLNAPH
jgi:acyl-CoA reductase-like NAD-dependent aldehyde dehydrogenase